MQFAPTTIRPYSTYPYDVTAPGPDQRLGQEVAQTTFSSPSPGICEPVPIKKKESIIPKDDPESSDQ